MKVNKQDLSGLLDIYKIDKAWFVDYKGGVYSDFPENIGMSEKSENEALKFALVNLAIMELKNSEMLEMLNELNNKFNSYEFDQRHKELKKPTTEVLYEIEME